MGRSTTSAHLQVLRRARLVDTRREGTQIHYRLAGPEVSDLLTALRQVAAAQLAEVDQITRDYFDERDGLEPMGRDELLDRAGRDEVLVVDVRPEAEYRAGHIPDAVSIPLEELTERIDELPGQAEIVAYCRGSYCVLSADAVAVLREHGRQAPAARWLSVRQASSCWSSTSFGARPAVVDRRRAAGVHLRRERRPTDHPAGRRAANRQDLAPTRTGDGDRAPAEPVVLH